MIALTQPTVKPAFESRQITTEPHLHPGKLVRSSGEIGVMVISAVDCLQKIQQLTIDTVTVSLDVKNFLRAAKFT